MINSLKAIKGQRGQKNKGQRGREMMNQSSAPGGAVFHSRGGAATTQLRPQGRRKPRVAAASYRAAGTHPCTGPEALGMSCG